MSKKAFAVALPLLLIACTSTFEIPVIEAPEVRSGNKVRTLSGQMRTIEPEYRLRLVPFRDVKAAPRNELMNGPVNMQLQDGLLTLVTPKVRMQIPAEDVRYVEIEQCSSNKTVAIVVPTLVGSGVLVGVIVAFAVGLAEMAGGGYNLR